MLGVFAVLSLALSAVGIYGVVAAAAARRTRELALRLALGARPEGPAGGASREGAVPVGVGLAAGLALALAAGRLANRFLFGVTASDLPTFAAAVSCSRRAPCSRRTCRHAGHESRSHAGPANRVRRVRSNR